MEPPCTAPRRLPARRRRKPEEAAAEIDNMKTILTELRITNRIIIALLIAVLIKSFFCNPKEQIC